MVKIYCDRCGSSMIVGGKSNFEKATELNVGNYFGDIYVVTEDGKNEGKNDYEVVDICDRCQKDFGELLSSFMSSFEMTKVGV